jgi:hypothetical protein
LVDSSLWKVNDVALEKTQPGFPEVPFIIFGDYWYNGPVSKTAGVKVRPDERGSHTADFT